MLNIRKKINGSELRVGGGAFQNVAPLCTAEFAIQQEGGAPCMSSAHLRASY
jgi:hypothetical protein